jgi:hypothetical protein
MSVLSQPFVRRKKPQPEKIRKSATPKAASPSRVSLKISARTPDGDPRIVRDGVGLCRLQGQLQGGHRRHSPRLSRTLLDDLAKFGKMVSLVSFSPFKSAAHALENANDVSEGQSRFFWCFSVASWLVLGVCVYQPLRISCSRTGRMIEDPMSLARVADMYFPFGQAS